MSYSPFKIGQVVSNEEMRSAYRIGNMGGMRKSNTYNCLVLISDHTKGIYEDKWHGEVLHYTGMGKTGDQKIQGNQNETLYYSEINGVEVHLFEVIVKGEYTYRGVVKLADAPYTSSQPDVEGKMRTVWIFPITPISGAPEYKEEVLIELHNERQKQAEKLSLADLEKAAKQRSSKEPAVCKVTAKRIERDEYVAAYTKKRANGICQLCGNKAPFLDKNGNPYLESHHIVWLSKGGEDTIENSVALCPNCHKKMHIVDDLEDVKKLKAKSTSI